MKKFFVNSKTFAKTILFFVVLAMIGTQNSCTTPQAHGNLKKNITDTLIFNVNGGGTVLQFTFIKGKAHNHPLMALWLEDEEGGYIQTLFVTQSIATGIFKYGRHENGKWVAAPRKRPAALPYWSHKSGVAFVDSVSSTVKSTIIPDAYSGATPKGNFVLTTITEKPLVAGRYKIFFEVNQTWDWNDYWHNNKFPDDEEYKTSCQPAIVYAATIDLSKIGVKYELLPIGHSHYNGSDGSLNTDLSTLTTALQIVQKVTVEVIR